MDFHSIFTAWAHVRVPRLIFLKTFEILHGDNQVALVIELL